MLDDLFLSPYSFETGSFNELEAKLAASRLSNVFFSTLDNAGVKSSYMATLSFPHECWGFELRGSH